jgi:hypothetical protein
LQLLLAMQILCVVIIFPAAVSEMSEAISQFYDFYTVLVCMFYYVTDLLASCHISLLHLCIYLNSLFRTGINISMLIVKVITKVLALRTET